MNRNQDSPTAAANLRRLAEDRLSEKQSNRKSEVGGQRLTDDVVRLTYELQVHQNVTVGREMRMIELKAEINALLKAAGQPAKYTIVDEDA
jgi:hypothetical protein